MKIIYNLWKQLDPSSQGSAYLPMLRERLPKLDSLISFRLKGKWAFRKY